MVNVVYRQNAGVNTWMLIAYYGSYALFALIVLLVCIFFVLDRQIPQIHKELAERARKAAESRGESYIAPEEQERLEAEAAARELEEARIADLRKRCEKKGLNFEKEERKYQEKLAKKSKKKSR